MQASFRICTEDRANLESIAARYFEAFTVFRGVGSWRGVQERSACLEIFSWNPDSDRRNVYNVAEAIRDENSQESVLVVEIPSSGVLI